MTLSVDNQTHAATLIEGLSRSGMAAAVISPGSRSTPLVLALAALDRIDKTVILDERAAGFYALGLARATGRPVGLVCTSGSAGAHYLPALIEASQTGVPLIVMTADRPPELHHCGAGQTIDQVHLFGSHVRRTFHLGAPHRGSSAAHLRTLAAQAIDAAMGSPRGPVHLNVPFRKPLWTAGDASRVQGLGSARVARGPAVAPAEVVGEVAARARASRRGAIVCGPFWPKGGAAEAEALGEAVSALATRLGWPIIAEPTSQLRFGMPEGAPLVTSADALLRCETVAGRFKPDMILQIGQAPTSKPVSQWVARWGRDNIVLVDADGLWRDPSHGADLLVVAEPEPFVRALTDAVVVEAKGWWRDWLRLEEAASAVIEAHCDDGLWEGAVAQTVSEVLPEGAMLHAASSMPIRDLDGFGRNNRRLHVLSSRGANGIDGMLATALGERRGMGGVGVLLVGDLAFLHDIGSLVHVPGTLTVVVVNNGGGGIFGFLPIAAHETAFEPYFTTPSGADIGALSKAAGAFHVSVNSIEGLESALVEDLGREGVGVIEVVVDRAENLSRHEAVWSAVASAVEEGML